MLVLLGSKRIVSCTHDSFRDNMMCVLIDQFYTIYYIQDKHDCVLRLTHFGLAFGSPRRRRDDRRHESDRARHKSRDEESARAADHDQKRNKDVVGGDGPLNEEVKSLSHMKDDPPARRDRSPRGTKRFSESRESRRLQSFFQVLVFSPL